MKKVDNVPGLYYIENFLTKEEESNLLKEIDQNNKWVNTLGKYSRVVQQYGAYFDYLNHDKLTPAPEFFPLLKATSQKIEHVIKEELKQEHNFNQCIINNYNKSQRITAHVDYHHFGPLIACVSIFGEATMRFTNKSTSVDIIVKPRSLYIMSGPARSIWTHEMLPCKEERRISITLRTLTTSALTMIKQFDTSICLNTNK